MVRIKKYKYLILCLLIIYFIGFSFFLLKTFKDFKVDYNEGSNQNVIGELVDNKIIEQTFMTNKKNLCGVGIKFATYARVNTNRINIKVKSKNKYLYDKTIEASILGDNLYYNLMFNDVIKNSKNKKYEIIISGINCSSNNTVTIWQNPLENIKGTKLKVDNKELNGHILFSSIYKNDMLVNLKNSILKIPVNKYLVISIGLAMIICFIFYLKVLFFEELT